MNVDPTQTPDEDNPVGHADDGKAPTPLPLTPQRRNGKHYVQPIGETELFDTPAVRQGLKELAGLSEVQYYLERDEHARNMHIPAYSLDKLVEWARAELEHQGFSKSDAIDAFEEQFVNPEYLVDGILHTRYLYTLTGHSNAGKTALAAALTCAVDSGTPFAGSETMRSPVLYLCGENEDDFRMRIMATYQEHWVHHPRQERRVHIIHRAFPMRKHYQFVLDEVARLGGVRLIVIDTSMAYSDYEDENSNAQIAEHTRACRKLTRAAGDPTVLALCHPSKNATEENLVPRGGSAMLNEVDTNLTLWFSEDEVTFSHTKIRGVPFAPLKFRFQPVDLVGRFDAKERAIGTVVMEPAGEGSRREGRPPKGGMPPHASIAYQSLQEVLEREGHSLMEGTSVIPANTSFVPLELWQRQFYSRLGEDNDATRRSAWSRGRAFLLGHNIVQIWDEHVWCLK